MGWQDWVSVGFAICIPFLFAIAAWLDWRNRPTRLDRARQEYARARIEADDAFHEARVRMEEAAGRRRAGERRAGDLIRGSWQEW